MIFGVYSRPTLCYNNQCVLFISMSKRTMQNIQEIFNHMQEIKRQQKTIREMYKNSLNNSAQYKEISEKIKELRLKKKEVEMAIQADFNNEFSKLDGLKIEMEGDKTMLSDVALNKLMQGEPVEVMDEHNTRYEPVFTVAFKKI